MDTASGPRHRARAPHRRWRDCAALRRPDRCAGHQRQRVRRRRTRHRSAVGTARRPGGRPRQRHRYGDHRTSRTTRLLDAHARCERVSTAAGRCLRQRVDGVRGTGRGWQRLHSGGAAGRRRHGHPATVVRHVRRPVADRPHRRRRARARGPGQPGTPPPRPRRDRCRRRGVRGGPRRQPPRRGVRRHACSVGPGDRHPAHRRGDRLRRRAVAHLRRRRPRRHQARGRGLARPVDAGRAEPDLGRDQPGQLHLRRQLPGRPVAHRPQRLPRRAQPPWSWPRPSTCRSG